MSWSRFAHGWSIMSRRGDILSMIEHSPLIGGGLNHHVRLLGFDRSLWSRLRSLRNL
jgi:hypothetical protein